MSNVARLIFVALVSVLVAGCGGDSKNSSSAPDALKPTTTATPAQSNAPTELTPEPHPAAKTVTLPVPSGWSAPKPPVASHIWPRALKVVASFPIRLLPANAACPQALLDAMPPDGIYVLVAEYTKPRPPGFPAPRKFGPRPDLSQLDIRPAEVECWDGLGGATEFTEKGRSFRVQVLLGPKVTDAQRRQALQTVNGLKIG